MRGRRWRVRISDAARDDLGEIMRWTTENFGAEQARRYKSVILATADELSGGPEPLGHRVVGGLRALYVARRGRRGRHFLLYRVLDETTIEVSRILHDQMDLQRHVPSSDSLN
jgi:toxin ParE1/3/4